MSESILAAIIAAIEEEEQSANIPQNRKGKRNKQLYFVPTGTVIPPQYSSSEIGNVDASTVAVTFDKNVSSSDYSTGVTIKVNSAAATISSAARQTDHAIVYYVLSAAAVSGDTVTWEYSGGVIVSESDNAPLGTVTAQTVTNNITGDEMSIATVTLTNAQIKHLPATLAAEWIEIVPAPGPGKVIFAPVAMGTGQASLLLDWHGDYSNVNSDAEFVFTIGDNSIDFKYGLGQSSLGTGNLTNFFAWGVGGVDNPYWLLSAYDSAIGGAAPNQNSLSDYANKPLLFFVLNGGDGDFTGGDDLNTLKVTVQYSVIDV